MLGSSRSMARKDFGISCFQTLLFLIEVILPSLSAYGLAKVLLSDIAKCGHRFSHDIVPAAGVSSGLTRLFFSEAFMLILVQAVLAQIHTNLFVISFATLCRVGLFRARARAILAGLYKPTVPATFLKAAAVLWTAFWLLDDQRELEMSLMVLGGIAPYLAWMVGMAVSCRLACAVPVLEDASASGFGSMRRRLALVGAGKFWAVAAIIALLGGIIVPVAALTATVFPSHLLVAGTAFAAVRCTMMVVMLVAQPVVYLVLWNDYHSFY